MTQAIRPANVVLIGMPGVGKSTVGVLLAKSLSRGFLDTDLLIQALEGRRLQDIIDSEGTEAFCAIEERHVLALKCCDNVIATGGSVVYSPRAMAHLKAMGVLVHLYLPFDLLAQRVRNLDSRGVVVRNVPFRPGERPVRPAASQTLQQLYEERLPLYRRYADRAVDCAGLNHEQVVAAVIREVASGKVAGG